MAASELSSEGRSYSPLRFGQVSSRAHISLPGFIRSGHAVGDMVISTDQGSVSLHLVSGDLPGFAAAEGTYASAGR